MRRIVLALLGTAIGTTLLVGLKTQVAVAQLGLSAATPADAGAGGDPANGQPSASSAVAGPSAAAAGPSAAASTTAPAAKAGPSATAGTASKPPTAPATAPATAPPTAPATAPKTTAPPPAARTILGDAVAASEFGNMQVKIVVTGTHIDDIVTVQKSNRPGSVSTTLRAQALSAQSSNVGNVSGATFSSTAYKQSLQSAIAKI
jgi:uncharacterized protein with FMN-binding domain